jgi:hypothetical protein
MASGEETIESEKKKIESGEKKMNRGWFFFPTLLAISLLMAGVGIGMYKMGKLPRYDDFEMTKLFFASAILAFLAFIFMLSIIAYAFGPEPTSPSTESAGKIIFDACAKIIPPIVTLIIGFYFGTTQGPKDSNSLKEKPATQIITPDNPTEPGKATPDKTTEPDKTASGKTMEPGKATSGKTTEPGK